MTKHESDDLILFNGINAETGTYDIEPMLAGKLAEQIAGMPEPENLDELRFRYFSRVSAHLGVAEGVDPKRLDEAGWGVIFHDDSPPEVQEALSELLAWRRRQAGQRFQIYKYRSGESKSMFLARHGAGPGPANPDYVPYYLLIVAGPESVPYRFQYELDVQYAVGRIDFATLEEYQNYARSVVIAESGRVKLPRRGVFFSVSNDDDPNTKTSNEYLIQPLASNLAKRQQRSGWDFHVVAPVEATKNHLRSLLGGEETPAFLFTSSHGMRFPESAPSMRADQGALLCQDWPGPLEWPGGPIPPDYYFAAQDVVAEANLLGSMAFFFACFGAGTPRYDTVSSHSAAERKQLSAEPFVAHLPKRLLSHPNGGALAVVGHIDRALGYSFRWPGAGAQTTVFQSMIERLLSGHPVGSAVEYLNERYAELAVDLNNTVEEMEFGKRVDPYALAGLWAAKNDAQNYAVIGDPAVRLPVAEGADLTVQRPRL